MIKRMVNKDVFFLKYYSIGFLLFLPSCDKTGEEPIPEICDEEPMLLSEEVEGNITTTTYQICSSDIPENWLISVTDLVEQINQYSNCSWVETVQEPKGESFEILIDIEKYSTMRLEKIEGLSSIFEYSSDVLVPATIQFSQKGETHSSSMSFGVWVDAYHEADSEGIYFDFGDIGLPYESNEDLTFSAQMRLDGPSEVAGWSAFIDKTVSGVEIIASAREYQYSTAVCTKE